MTQPLLQAADLRGAASLTTEAVAGLVSLVAAMRARILTLPRLHGHRNAASLLDWLAPALAATDAHLPPSVEREAILAGLNGLLGDHLATTDHPLAIAMQFRHAGRPLQLERHALRARLPRATPRLIVLLHDLCMNDLQWQHADHDHGEALARDLGYTPVHLHYNSGLSVSTNGRILAPRMEALYSAWPGTVERLVLLGHGMGGLVARSALYYGALPQRGGLRWAGRVDDLVCLGTPHRGAPMDRAGHGVDLLLSATPCAAALARLGKVPSAGIDDLRLGRTLKGPSTDDATYRADRASLPEGTRCFSVAASLGRASSDLAATPAGDGLVPVASALGPPDEPGLDLRFTPERRAVVHGTGHLELLSSAEVYGLLRQWLH